MARKRPNKSAFIRNHPSASAAEVVALGKKAGLKFAVEYVYSIRQAAKRAERKGRVPGKAGRPFQTKTRPTTKRVPQTEARTAVWNVVYLYGVANVKEIVAGIERELAAKTGRG